MRKTLLSLSAFALLSSAGQALAGDIQVNVTHSAFEPPEVTVNAGDTVLFVNQRIMNSGHVVIADDGSFKGTELYNPGQTWAHTFDKPGVYPIHLGEPHLQVKGTITVK